MAIHYQRNHKYEQENQSEIAFSEIWVPVAEIRHTILVILILGCGGENKETWHRWDQRQNPCRENKSEIQFEFELNF